MLASHSQHHSFHFQYVVTWGSDLCLHSQHLGSGMECPEIQDQLELLKEVKNRLYKILYQERGGGRNGGRETRKRTESETRRNIRVHGEGTKSDVQ